MEDNQPLRDDNVESYEAYASYIDKESEKLIPSIWNLAEKMVSPDIENRRVGLESIVELDVLPRFPLLVYILATRITEPDIDLRGEVVNALANVLVTQSKNGSVTPGSSILSDFLSRMRTRQVYSLLQVVDTNPVSEPHVMELLKACSFASNHLSDILSDRRTPVAIRKLATKFIGDIGYLDSISTLERMETRLESRFPSQQTLPGIVVREDEEASLLPMIRNALALLRAP